MKILAIDTTAIVATVAITEDTKPLAHYTINNGNTHSETILPMIESILNSLSLKISDIDLFALSAGPGSFTGVRIGAATVKGLAFDSNKPCVEVSTLEALAQNLVLRNGLICAVMNARRSQVYTALFRSDGKELTRLTPDSALAISELDELLSKYSEEVALVGDGYEITQKDLKLTKTVFVPHTTRDQSALSVATVAYKKYLLDETCSDAALSVNYLRPSQAERERAEREAQNNENKKTLKRGQ